VNGEDLSSFVNDYQLEVDGVKFWTPYWRDELPTTKHPMPKTGPYKGKGTPQQLLHNLQGYLKTSTQRRPTDPESYRELMHQLHLGVDCSGFAFYILELWLAQRKIRLADHLFKPRADLLADFANPVYRHPPNITRKLLESQPEQVPLSTIHEFWGNEPVRLAGVSYLTSDAATIAVQKVADIIPGDIVAMTGKDGIPHCVVVIDRKDQEITYAHSGLTPPSKLGGVEYGSVTVIDPQAPINAQYWESGLLERMQLDSSSVRRLKVVSSHHA